MIATVSGDGYTSRCSRKCSQRVSDPCATLTCMDEITLAPEQLARLVEYGEVTVYVDGRYVRLKVREAEGVSAVGRR